MSNVDSLFIRLKDIEGLKITSRTIEIKGYAYLYQDGLNLEHNLYEALIEIKAHVKALEMLKDVKVVLP